jgi:L-alanine-DL-glutamate epimerase-like enolase superfamily enzyme
MKHEARMALEVRRERWALKSPIRITNYTFDAIETVLVTLRANGLSGRAEAAGVYYRDDTVEAMLTTIESVRPQIEAGIDRRTLAERLPAGGARNALDCALWDLDAKRAGRPAWALAGLDEPRPLVTTTTMSAREPEAMAAEALTFPDARAIKLKLTGQPEDAARVRAVREARPDVWLAIDANQGFTRASLAHLLPTLIESRVELVEQPFPVGREDWLDDIDCPIDVAADESAQDSADIARLARRFDVINIKLDKCGGLTEGLAMAARARKAGLKLMVGNMAGTSLAMAPAFVLGQLCDVVDLDGPLFLEHDRSPSVVYENGCVRSPQAVWGGSA